MELLLLLLAPAIGILVGLMPGLGPMFVLLILYPVLNMMSPAVLIAFYAVMISARDFSGSVAALCFGTLGEVTSAPALRERGIITDHGATQQALKDTARASLIGMGVSLVAMLVCLSQGQAWPMLFRTEVIAVLLFVTLTFVTAWPGNRAMINLVLIALGWIVGSVGYNMQTGQDFLTLGNVYLAGGIPITPVVLGVYAVPTMLLIKHQQSPLSIVVDINGYVRRPFAWLSALRGSAVGFVCGLVPYVGGIITSNLAHSVESRFRKQPHLTDSLARLTAAEAANNASQVSSLIPFVLLGLAVQPSELVILDILTNQGWRAANLDWYMVGLVAASLLAGCAVVAWVCSSVVKQLLGWFQKYYSTIVSMLIVLLTITVAYQGWRSDQTMYYMLVFVVSGAVGWITARKVDFMPLVLVLLLENQLNGVTNRLIQLYL
jgi:putative tricarboxylic transport membrane protein